MNFYVYVHRKKTTGEVFYVGKGKGNRAWSKKGRNDHWNRVAKKYGFTVEIHTNDIQEWYAFELERELIAYYGRVQDGTGTLVNYTDGGEGPSGLDCAKTDKNIYNFYNFKTGETFTGLRIAFKKHHKIDPAPLFHKQSERVDINISGWILYDKEIPKEVRVGYAGKLAPNWDQTIYNFINMKTGETYKGTKIDFREKTGLETGNMFSRGAANKFWFCIESSDLMNMYYSVNEGRPNPNADKKVYNFENFDGEVFTGTRSQIREQKGLKTEFLFCVNPALTYQGWFLQEKKEEVLRSRNNFEEYTFYNVNTKEKIVTTRRQFQDTHMDVAIHHVLQGRCTTIKNWTVLEIVNKQELQKSEEGRTGANFHLSDKTMYRFVHKETGEVFEGLRSEMKSIKGVDVSDLFRKVRKSKTIKGWSLSPQQSE